MRRDGKDVLTVDRWLEEWAAIEAREEQRNKRDGWRTTRELQARYHWPERRMYGFLRQAIAEGKAECKRIPITDIAGRRQMQPAYRLKVKPKARQS